MVASARAKRHAILHAADLLPCAHAPRALVAIACAACASTRLFPDRGQNNLPAGWTPAREKERGCVAQNVRFPRELLLSSPNLVTTLVFRVREDGAVDEVRIKEPVPEALRMELERVLQRCRFEPARDAEGRVQPTKLVMPLRFSNA